MTTMPETEPLSGDSSNQNEVLLEVKNLKMH